METWLQVLEDWLTGALSDVPSDPTDGSVTLDSRDDIVPADSGGASPPFELEDAMELGG